MNAYTSIDLPFPKGGHTLEGLLARNPEVAIRFKALEDDAALAAAEHEGALAAHTRGQDAVNEAKEDYSHLAAAYGHYKLHPESREAGELARAAEAVERAMAIVKDRTSPALQHATDRSGHATEIASSARRFLAGRKTEDTLRLRKVTAELADGVSHFDAIAAKTATIANRQRRRGAVATALPPADSVKRTLRTQIAATAARAEVELTGLYDGGKRIGFALPTIALKDAEPNRFRPNEQPRVIDMEALACRFFGDAIIADLEAQVNAAYADELGDEVLDASEKRTLLASLDREIDQLQRELAELIWQAREAGHDVDFPTDLPAAAILGVA